MSENGRRIIIGLFGGLMIISIVVLSVISIGVIDVYRWLKGKNGKAN